MRNLTRAFTFFQQEKHTRTMSGEASEYADAPEQRLSGTKKRLFCARNASENLSLRVLYSSFSSPSFSP